ncbi:hypothetical protein L3i22_060020 [Actinoplanes sp. L3-i22]|nr:hypothetical protein L3i22_060020 [Actinoplanes sp. L3-i22]
MALASASITQVAAQYRTSRQSLHTWRARFEADGKPGLAETRRSSCSRATARSSPAGTARTGQLRTPTADSAADGEELAIRPREDTTPIARLRARGKDAHPG